MRISDWSSDVCSSDLTRRKEDVGLLDERDPTVLVEAGQCGELEDSHRLPAQVDHGILRRATDELPGSLTRADRWVPIHRGGDAQGAGVPDRLAQHLDQLPPDAGVGYAPGREKKDRK